MEEKTRRTTRKEGGFWMQKNCARNCARWICCVKKCVKIPAAKYSHLYVCTRARGKLSAYFGAKCAHTQIAKWVKKNTFTILFFLLLFAHSLVCDRFYFFSFSWFWAFNSQAPLSRSRVCAHAICMPCSILSGKHIDDINSSVCTWRHFLYICIVYTRALTECWHCRNSIIRGHKLRSVSVCVCVCFTSFFTLAFFASMSPLHTFNSSGSIIITTIQCTFWIRSQQCVYVRVFRFIYLIFLFLRDNSFKYS